MKVQIFAKHANCQDRKNNACFFVNTDDDFISKLGKTKGIRMEKNLAKMKL